jgi:addiction module HigA family antidote
LRNAQHGQQEVAVSKAPGEVLREQFLEPLGLNANRLAVGLGVHRSTVGRLLSGDQRLSPELAARLGAYFGTPARWWLLLQTEHDAARADRGELDVSGVTPLSLPSDVLLTPKGVLQLTPKRSDATSTAAPVSLRVASRPEQRAGEVEPARTVREVRYANGAVALVGDAG